MIEPFRNNQDHLAAELAWLNLLLQREVRLWRRQAGDSQPDFRGVYLSDAQIDSILDHSAHTADAQAEQWDDAARTLRGQIDERAQASLAEGAPLALKRAARLFGLTAFEERVLLIALAPEIDLDYEKLFAYLQDDMTRRRPSVDLAMRLLCRGPLTRVWDSQS